LYYSLRSREYKSLVPTVNSLILAFGSQQDVSTSIGRG